MQVFAGAGVSGGSLVSGSNLYLRPADGGVRGTQKFSQKSGRKSWSLFLSYVTSP